MLYNSDVTIGGNMTQSVKGTRTKENLKAAFAGESQAIVDTCISQTWPT